MDKEERKASVTKHTKHIRSRIWMILLSALLPFLLLALAIVMQADTTNEKLLETALFLLAAGISFLATKLASYTIIDRYLSLIESLDDTKSDFISIASHQLKSPVSSLKYTMDVFTDALENEDWETVRDFSGDIDLSVKRLDSLTHRLLDVARAEAGSLEAESEMFNVTDRLKEIASELEPLAEKKGISLDITNEIDKTVDIKVDPSFFYNVIDNLLTNALDYAPSDTTVSIKVQKEGNAVKVSFCNIAESTNADDFIDIFTKFSRGNNKKSNKTVGGSGLGLFIAKSYVESWGGDIDANLNNDQNKQRAIFSFTVPLDLN